MNMDVIVILKSGVAIHGSFWISEAVEEMYDKFGRLPEEREVELIQSIRGEGPTFCLTSAQLIGDFKIGNYEFGHNCRRMYIEKSEVAAITLSR